MSVFRRRAKSNEPPKSPKEVFDRLPPSSQVKFLWAHQDAALANYCDKRSNADIAVELPTGSGKTLIGLLIAEFQRLALKRRVVYLCPTRQLAYQTKSRASGYGIDSVCLVGSKNEYNTSDLAAYERGQAVAITTYSSIFNIKPGLEAPEVVICDDAHAGESFVADMWSLNVSAETEQPLFLELLGFFKDAIRPGFASTSSTREVDLVPLPRYLKQIDKLQDLLNDYCMRSESLRYNWMALKGHLAACCVYVSRDLFLIRPLIPPTMMHTAFAGAMHRVYMSATIGEDGDLERMFGLSKIHKISSTELKEANTGRRLVLFPELMQAEAASIVGGAVTDLNERVLVITSGGSRVTSSIRKPLKKKGFHVLEAKDIEENLRKFTEGTSTALLLSNRYDGIDLPGEQCRRLLLFGLPSALNLQEQFLRDRLGAHTIMRNRIRVRLTQAMGRCTRDKNDYALVVCDERGLKSWCASVTNTKGLGAELQAELEFGLDQSEGENRTGMTATTARAVLEEFFNQSDVWLNQADADIRERAKELTRVRDESANALSASAPTEVAYVYALWRADFVEALSNAVSTIDLLHGRALRPYRAFWEYLAAIAADGAFSISGEEKYKTAFIQHVKNAAAATGGVRWMASLAFAHPTIVPAEEVSAGVSGVCELLSNDWGLRGPNFNKALAEVKKNIGSDEAKPFHEGLRVLGRMLGFKAKTYNADAAPDCVWYSEDGHRYVFEAKTGSKPEGGIPFKSVRQARMHPEWVDQNDNDIPPARIVYIVIVTPQQKIDRDAASIADTICYLHTDSLRQLFEETSRTITELRGAARAMDEDELYDHVLEAYHKAGLTDDALRKRLRGKELRTLPLA